MKEFQSPAGERQSLLADGAPQAAAAVKSSSNADNVEQSYSSLSFDEGCFDVMEDSQYLHRDLVEQNESTTGNFMSHKFAYVSIGSVLLLSIHIFFGWHYVFIKEQPVLKRGHHQENNHDIINNILSLHREPLGFDKAYSSITNEPLSYKSPEELGIPVHNNRPSNSLPGSVFGKVQQGTKIGVPLPTNEWYLNLIVGLDDNPGDNNLYENYAGEENRVHSIPYIVDTVGPIVGIRLHYPNIMSYGTVIQSVFVATHGLSLGTVDSGFTRRYEIDPDTLPSKLGVGIRWNSEYGKHKQSKTYMSSRILRGMPYGTMEYAYGTNPVIASEVVAELPVIDGADELHCGKLDHTNKNKPGGAEPFLAKKDIELYFPESDFTWLVFFSRPVQVKCFLNPNKAIGSVSLPPGAASLSDNPNAFQLHLQVAHNSIEPLIVRVALANNCTTGTNVNFCTQYQAEDQTKFTSVLREHSSVYPTSPLVKYSFFDPEGPLTPETPDSKSAYLFFDWKARHFTKDTSKELITFALPHHVDILRKINGQSSNRMIGHCMHSLHGRACLVKGGLWAMEEVLGNLPSFVSPRPANHKAIPALANALSNDIKYSLPDNYMRGAGDTYFSGKMLAKLGRIIVIAQELRGLAESPDNDVPDTQELADIIHACKHETLPTENDVVNAIDRLRQGVEVWLNGTASAPLTFDHSWGGIISCGCLYNKEGDCDNTIPDCPAYLDPGLNFGQGFYNDHHFHFGYHIYAAAILSQYDRDWGKRYFERILLLIRDIANPSVKDQFFPVFRQKDWYLGNSWASGIALFGGRPYLNGRNQESSSEAIAAYEGIAMYGSVMMKAFGNGRSATESDNENAYTACEIFNIGRFLATTEIRSADRYWHVYSPNRDMIYPDNYKPAVVSMMWDTMCQFQTWFGSAAYLAYGIQLLPLTPVSERRDTDQWLRQLYPSFVESCDSTDACVKEGWAVLLYAVIASLGHQDLALEKALALPNEAFTSAGGSGHSLSNTLWYIASRPKPTVPYDLEEPSTSIHSKSVPKSAKETILDCGCPETCNAESLDTNANGFTCKERIQWLMLNRGLNELGACKQVAGNEYPSICGACDPGTCSATPSENKAVNATTGCSPCKEEICSSPLNKCQIDTAPFLCYAGNARGGCSSVPWPTGEGIICTACCEIFSGC